MITIGKTKSVCPECMKVVPAIKGIGEDGIYLVKECNAHGKFQTLIWEGNAAFYCKDITHLDWGVIMEKCPGLIADTYTKVMEILTEREVLKL